MDSASSKIDNNNPPAYDADGFLVPTEIGGMPVSRERWDQMNIAARRKYSETYRERLERTEPAKQAQTRAPSKRYTTAAAIAWGRAQGWKLIDRERYDNRLQRHHDLPLGADAMFETPAGIVYVQGAGRYERAPHRARFEERGGTERAERLRVRFVYAEFLRGQAAPVLVEWWS